MENAIIISAFCVTFLLAKLLNYYISRSLKKDKEESHTVRFQSPIKEDDKIEVEVKTGGTDIDPEWTLLSEIKKRNELKERVDIIERRLNLLISNIKKEKRRAKAKGRMP